MSYFGSNNTITFQNWMMRVEAAELTQIGNTRLPGRRGHIPLHPISPERIGIHQPHPMTRAYPDIEIQYFLMEIRPEFKVYRNGLEGVSFFLDWNGTSDVWASILSIGNRNGVALANWDGSKTHLGQDPRAGHKLEKRPIYDDNGQTIVGYWQNHLIHGWYANDGTYQGLDWLDGPPKGPLKYVHSPVHGRVLQYIWVPRLEKYQGLGLAEQTLDPADLVDTFSILVFPAKDEHLEQMRPHRPISKYRDQWLEAASKQALSFGNLRGGIKLGVEPEPEPAQFKVAIGQEIIQPIIPNNFDLSWFEPAAFLAVCLPVTPDKAEELTRPTTDGGTPIRRF